MKKEKINRFLKILKTTAKNPTTWKVLGLCTLLASTNAGYCDTTPPQGIESQVKVIQDVIFGKGIRMVVLLFGITWGFFKSVMSGSFQPILLYGGIGFCFFFTFVVPI